MSASVAGEGPAVVTRSRYVRPFLVGAGVALAFALGAVVANDDDSSAPASPPAARQPLVNPPHDTHENAPCGLRYVGSILVGKPCASAAEPPN
jgi:hypothetical protein